MEPTTPVDQTPAEPAAQALPVTAPTTAPEAAGTAGLVSAAVVPPAPQPVKSVTINLLGHDEARHGGQDKQTSPTAPRLLGSGNRRTWAVVMVAAIAIMSTGGLILAAGKAIKKPAANPAAKSPAKPAPAAAPAAAPPAAPPPPAPATTKPQTVTTPAVTPTKDHPQTVTVQSTSGLWLRSTADSSNKNNIVGWIPNGGRVSVDQIGDFWWHGTYKGTTGYFASKYTQ